MVVVLAVALAVGLVLARRRRISLVPTPTTAPAVDRPPAKGGYRTGSSISFSPSGGGTALAEPPLAEPPLAEPPLAEPQERTETDGQPGVGDDAAIPRDSIRRDVIDVALPDLDQPSALAPQPAPKLPAPAPEPDLELRPVPEAVPEAQPGIEREPEPEPVEVLHVPIEELSTTPPLEEIAPTAGRLGRLRGRLARSQNTFGRSLLGLLGAGTLDEDSWTDVEDTLLMADLGAGAAAEITAQLRREVAAHGVTDAASARALLRRVLIQAVDTVADGQVPDRSIHALPSNGQPSVLLIVGVNGTGKTTTTGKLARVLVADGRTVVLGAADTFRAAAADQLQTWGERAGATVVRSVAGADPAAVAFDAVRTGITDGADAVLIDTAGRLHTKTGLMDELGKVKRVIEKQAELAEILLVLDATTGQNGLVQARVFAEVVQVTGIVLTKLDGTAKGGIVVAVQRALGVPVKLVGLGEGPDDLAPFEPAAFVDALLGD